MQIRNPLLSHNDVFHLTSAKRDTAGGVAALITRDRLVLSSIPTGDRISVGDSNNGNVQALDMVNQGSANEWKAYVGPATAQREIMVKGGPPYPRRHSVVSVTHDISITGAQAITGAGFKPYAVIVSAVVNGTKLQSQGFGDGVNSSVVQYSVDTGFNNNVASRLVGMIITQGVTEGVATFTSFDTDGMTITWAKTGLPTGTATLMIMFFA